MIYNPLTCSSSHENKGGDLVVVRNGLGFFFNGPKVDNIIVFHAREVEGRTTVHRIGREKNKVLQMLLLSNNREKEEE